MLALYKILYLLTYLKALFIYSPLTCALVYWPFLGKLVDILILRLLNFCMASCLSWCLQCFDIVGRTSGRACSL